MPAISFGPSGGPVIPVPTTPVAGTNAVQTLTIGGTPTGGSFRLAGGGGTGNPSIPWNSTNATLLASIQTALDAMFGASQVVASAGTLTAGIGTVLLTYSGANVGRYPQPTMTIAQNALTGTSPTLAVATTTAGVEATMRGAPRGTLIVAQDTGVVYRQTAATPLAPTWTTP